MEEELGVLDTEYLDIYNQVINLACLLNIHGTLSGLIYESKVQSRDLRWRYKILNNQHR